MRCFSLIYCFLVHIFFSNLLAWFLLLQHLGHYHELFFLSLYFWSNNSMTTWTAWMVPICRLFQYRMHFLQKCIIFLNCLFSRTVAKVLQDILDQRKYFNSLLFVNIRRNKLPERLGEFLACGDGEARVNRVYQHCSKLISEALTRGYHPCLYSYPVRDAGTSHDS